MATLKQIKAARAVIAAALVDDDMMTKKVAQAIVLIAEMDYGWRINGKITDSYYCKNRYGVTLTVDMSVKREDGWVSGGIETFDFANPSGWQYLVDDWTQNYEETGSWIGY
jgi:adenine-specific DNA methylase